MTDVASITATKLTTIRVPEALFSGPDMVEKEFRFLAFKYHPDRNGGDKQAEAAFKQLGELHAAAKDKIKKGEWVVPGQLDLIAEDGKKYRIRYVKEFVNGIATGYIGQSVVVYVLDGEYDDLVKSALQTIKNFKYPDDKYKKEMALYLPTVKTNFKTKDGRCVVVFNKSEDQIRLRDVVDHYGGKLDPRHAAWITSRMSNLTCYLEYAGITHNDLSMENIFICPEHHTAMIIGGWWHSAKSGERMKRRQTGRTVSVLPRVVADTKMASIKTDLALVRLLGREILGDTTGMSFIKDTTIPAPFSSWVKEAPIGIPVKDYARWEEVVVKSFGARRFTQMKLGHDDVYK